LAILDKEVRFGRNEYKLKVKPSNSRFKLFLHTIILRVKISLIAIETTTFYSHFRYQGENSRILVGMLCPKYGI